MSIFSSKTKAIVFIILQILCNVREKTFTTEQLIVSSVECLLSSVLWYDFVDKKFLLKNQKTFSYLE